MFVPCFNLQKKTIIVTAFLFLCLWNVVHSLTLLILILTQPLVIFLPQLDAQPSYAFLILTAKILYSYELILVSM